MKAIILVFGFLFISLPQAHAIDMLSYMAANDAKDDANKVNKKLGDYKHNNDRNIKSLQEKVKTLEETLATLAAENKLLQERMAAIEAAQPKKKTKSLVNK